MAILCKYCGGLSPDGRVKCKYCSMPFDAKTSEKSKAKASTKDGNKTSTKGKGSSSEKPSAAKPKTGGNTVAKKEPIKPKAKPSTDDKTQKPTAAGKIPKTSGKSAEKSASSAKKTGKSYELGYESCFDSADYLTKWKRFAKNGNAGLILTNSSGLTYPETFLLEIKKYCAARKAYVHYTILDLRTFPNKKNYSDCPTIVSLLNEIYSAAVPSYLMIVGDNSVIPFMNWENGAGDDDRFVPSDLPYITLDATSPWEGKDYSFIGATRVGRVPSSPINGFANAIKYFQFAATYKPLAVKPFALTAYEWTQASNLVFAKMKCPVLSSPEYTCSTSYVSTFGLRRVPDVSDKTLLAFNLHGSDGTHYWYGQKGSVYPEAFEAECLPKSKAGYTICVEACYGARPNVEKGCDRSIVLSALSDKCVAFVGSTRIAYGAVGSSMSCADVIAHAFIDSVTNSKTSGEAFLDSLTALLKSGHDENVIKTLAEFALYGDPSIIPFAGNASIVSASTANIGRKVKTKTNASKAIKLIPCDKTAVKSTNASFAVYSKEVEKSLVTVQNVSAVSDNYFGKNFSQIPKSKPKVFKVAGANEYRTIYKTKIGSKMVAYVKLHIDGKGKVLKTYISK